MYLNLDYEAFDTLSHRNFINFPLNNDVKDKLIKYCLVDSQGEFEEDKLKVWRER